MANKSQSSVFFTNPGSSSVTMTGSPVLVAPEDITRGALELMNCSAHDILIYFAEAGDTSTPTMSAGAAGIFTLAAAASAGKQGGSYEPSGGFIPPNALWAQGTNTDILAVLISKK